MVELPKIQLPVDKEVQKLTYKISLSAKSGEFSGIMIIKRMPDSAFRIAFFSEIGMSYLEGNMSGNFPYDLEIRTVNPFISGARTLQNLETALNLLLAHKANFISVDVLRDEDNRYWINTKTTGNKLFWGRVDTSGKIDRAFLNKRKKFEALFTYGDDSYPKKVECSGKRGELVILMTAL
jgi:hypothetical protein